MVTYGKERPKRRGRPSIFSVFHLADEADDAVDHATKEQTDSQGLAATRKGDHYSLQSSISDSTETSEKWPPPHPRVFDAGVSESPDEVANSTMQLRRNSVMSMVGWIEERVTSCPRAHVHADGATRRVATATAGDERAPETAGSTASNTPTEPKHHHRKLSRPFPLLHPPTTRPSRPKQLDRQTIEEVTTKKAPLEERSTNAKMFPYSKIPTQKQESDPKPDLPATPSDQPARELRGGGDANFVNPRPVPLVPPKSSERASRVSGQEAAELEPVNLTFEPQASFSSDATRTSEKSINVTAPTTGPSSGEHAVAVATPARYSDSSSARHYKWDDNLARQSTEASDAAKLISTRSDRVSTSTSSSKVLETEKLHLDDRDFSPEVWSYYRDFLRADPEKRKYPPERDIPYGGGPRFLQKGDDITSHPTKEDDVFTSAPHEPVIPPRSGSLPVYKTESLGAPGRAGRIVTSDPAKGTTRRAAGPLELPPGDADDYNLRYESVVTKKKDRARQLSDDDDDDGYTTSIPYKKDSSFTSSNTTVATSARKPGLRKARREGSNDDDEVIPILGPGKPTIVRSGRAAAPNQARSEPSEPSAQLERTTAAQRTAARGKARAEVIDYGATSAPIEDVPTRSKRPVFGLADDRYERRSFPPPSPSKRDKRFRDRIISAFGRRKNRGSESSQSRGPFLKENTSEATLRPARPSSSAPTTPDVPRFFRGGYMPGDVEIIHHADPPDLTGPLRPLASLPDVLGITPRPSSQTGDSTASRTPDASPTPGGVLEYDNRTISPGNATELLSHVQETAGDAGMLGAVLAAGYDGDTLALALETADALKKRDSNGTESRRGDAGPSTGQATPAETVSGMVEGPSKLEKDKTAVEEAKSTFARDQRTLNKEMIQDLIKHEKEAHELAKRNATVKQEEARIARAEEGELRHKLRHRYKALMNLTGRTVPADYDDLDSDAFDELSRDDDNFDFAVGL